VSYLYGSFTKETYNYFEDDEDFPPVEDLARMWEREVIRHARKVCDIGGFG